MSYHKPCRPSYLQYVAMRGAFESFIAATKANGGKKAKARFDKWLKETHGMVVT